MANAAVVIAGLVFFLASVGARAHVLLDWPSLRTGLDTFFQLAAFGAFLVLLVRRPLWAISLGLTYLLLLTNAFWSLYWPSLRPGIPVQDFMLADQVSANYSWDQVVLYLKTTGVMLTVGFAARVSWVAASGWARGALWGFAAAAIGLNLLVMAGQGLWNVEWLAAGSGSAVAHFRAAGLLQDSGASTVYAAAVLSGCLFAVVLAPMPMGRRLIWASVLLLSIVAAAATGGRIYFLSMAAAAVVGVCLLAFRSLRVVWAQVSLGALLAVAVLGAGIGLLSIHAGSLTESLANPTGVLNDALVEWDPIRVFHQKVMALAFLDRPWSGTGFGMFYANIFEFQQRALATGGYALSDPPASLYLLLASELGVGGVLIGFAGLAWLCGRLIRLARSTRDSRPDAWTAFAAGASVSVAVSFLVGIHVIFWSVPALAIPIAIGGASEPAPARRWFAPVWGAALLVIAIACAQLWATAPRSPEFRWKERGTPQIPVSLVVPIWPAGLEGVWASSGAEFLFEGKPLWFHIERPAEFYPMTFTIQVFDRGGREVATHEQVFEAPTGADPGRLIQVPFDDDVNSLCATNITPDDYCSFRITTTPEWTLDTQPVAVLYVTRNLR